MNFGKSLSKRPKGLLDRLFAYLSALPHSLYHETVGEAVIMSNLYADIARRTGGDIYIGVVGPVRTGKSTLIKRIMEELVIPNIEDLYQRERARDELEAQKTRAEAELARARAEAQAQLAEKLRAKDELIADREREIERIQDMRARLSTKMLGRVAGTALRDRVQPPAPYGLPARLLREGQRGGGGHQGRLRLPRLRRGGQRDRLHHVRDEE